MKKYLALLLALALLLGVCSGCGSKPEEETKTPAGAAETVPENDARLPLVPAGEEKTISIGVMQSPNVIDYDTNEYTLWLEEQTGVNLEFFCFSNNASEANRQVALMMAGGEELPDILWAFSGISEVGAQEYGEEGWFVDIAPYFGKYSPFFDEAIGKISCEADKERVLQLGSNPDTGAMYGFPQYQHTAVVDLTTNHIIINAKWLEAVGETMPRTPEDLRRVLIKFRDDDPNGNGKKDEIPMVGALKFTRANVIEWIINAYIYLNDNYFVNIDNGVVSAPQVTDEYREALIYLNDLYAEGLLSPMVYSISGYNEMKELITPSDGVAITGIGGGHDRLNHNEGSELIFEYEIMPTLDAGTGKGGYRTVNDSTFSYYTFITEDCDDPVLAFRLLDFMSSNESFYRARYGVEGRDWDYAAEGQTNSIGEQATLVLYTQAAFSEQNNSNWHVLYTIADYASCHLAYDSGETGETWSDRLNVWYNKNDAIMGEIPVKDELILRMVWATDDSVEMEEIAKVLFNYVKEARALFVTGEKDPRSDADWQEYLDTTRQLQIDRYVEIVQQTYDRLNNE